MDSLGLAPEFWREQRVFITGHTGFKGAWLSILLNKLGASLAGYSLPSPATPNLYDAARLHDLYITEHRNDIRDFITLNNAIQAFKPTILIHLAAQSLVIDGYDDPVTTYSTNVMGTVNTLEAARHCTTLTATLIVTSDKCYADLGKGEPHKESDTLGGYDPYSNSKACSELVTQCFNNSFFTNKSNSNIASARAGNVIGGGDWSRNRLLPDCYRAFSEETALKLRYPNAIRPWQHVLEPLSGYLKLIQRLSSDSFFARAWNFGPTVEGTMSVEHVAKTSADIWGNGIIELCSDISKQHETNILMLDSSDAYEHLDWQPKWAAESAVSKTIYWYKAYHKGGDARYLSEQQLTDYFSD